jgi:ribosome-associated translation inhibitor RaiA
LLWNKLNNESFLQLSFAGKNIEMTELLKTKINPLLAQTNKKFQTTSTEMHTDFLFENLFENTLDILNRL